MQLREGELRAGNINNSQFPFIEVRGIPLKDITSLSALSQYRSTIETAFGDNTWRTYEYKYILEKLNYLGSTFDAEVLRLKNKYYDSFSDWNKLGLMQYLLNYEYYKSMVCNVCPTPSGLAKFMFSDIATRPFIEDYAKNNRGGSVSLFDPRYPQIYRFKYQNNFCGGAIDYAEWQKDKKEALDKLVGNTSTSGLKIANLIGELKITVKSQKKWLYAHTTEAQKIIDFLNDNRVNGFASTQAIGFAKEASGIFTDLGSFNVSAETYTFDALNNPWLKVLREYAKRLEQIKNGISKNLYDALTKQLDHNLSVALTKTAFKLNSNADDTKEGNKEYWFKNDGKKGVGYLLYEFANGIGKDKRSFPFDYDMTQQMLAGNVPNDIKADFLKKLKDEGLSFNQFLLRTDPLLGGYSFSPDHTGVIDSFSKHVNANWVQFFIGGASAKYYPSTDPGWIIVELSNGTSRNSLLLHVGNEYKRDGTGVNKPLSTIKQVFRFKLKIQ
ncbi:MAG: hypothetical protein P8K77_04495 [Polaribacter sp.]|nr:hypothetical protein [Polaribacter sp.]